MHLNSLLCFLYEATASDAALGMASLARWDLVVDLLAVIEVVVVLAGRREPELDAVAGPGGVSVMSRLPGVDGVSSQVRRCTHGSESGDGRNPAGSPKRSGRSQVLGSHRQALPREKTWPATRLEEPILTYDRARVPFKCATSWVDRREDAYFGLHHRVRDLLGLRSGVRAEGQAWI